MEQIKCQHCGKVAPDCLQKQIIHSFVFETSDWFHNEETNKIMCPECFKGAFPEAV